MDKHLEEIVEKNVEIRGIGIASAFRLFFGIFLVVMLILFLSMQLFGAEIAMLLQKAIIWFSQVVSKLFSAFPWLSSNPVMSSLVIALVYSFFIALYFAFSAGIYSLFALLVGGISVKLRERVPVKSPFK